jgi:UDP-glucose 4-epimerase
VASLYIGGGKIYFMRNRILLVGGTGFLGRHLQFYLRDVAETFVTGTSPHSGSNYFLVDYTRPETFSAVDQRFDLVVFLAASVSGIGKVNMDHPDLHLNAISFGKFLQYVIDLQIGRKLIYISSMTVYGVNNNVPVEETGELQPLSVYGLSKLFAERELEFATRINNLKAVVARIPGLFGGDREGGFIYNTFKRCETHEEVKVFTAGLGYWECMHVDDLGAILTDFIRKYDWKETFDVFNFGYGEEIDIVNTARKIKMYCHSRSPINVVDGNNYRRFFMSNRKLRRVVALNANFDVALAAYIKKLKAGK